MNAGRELDALVAEKVFGAQFDFGNGPVGFSLFPQYLRELENSMPEPSSGTEAMFRIRKSEQAYKSLPRYSTDIAAAWEVVEKMRGDGFNLTLAITSTQVLGRFYTPENKVMWDSSPVFKGGIPMDTVALTAPHAICLAALRAVGFNSDELKTKETL